MRSRIKLEPVGRFAALVTLIHALLGIGIWWWWRSSHQEARESPGENVVWMSPSDFTRGAEPQKQIEPAPAPIVTATPPNKTEPKKSDTDDEDLPKAIAIDPTKAAELMAKALATEQATKPEPAKPAMAGTPAPAAAPSPTPESAPVVASTPVAPPKPPPPPAPDPKPPEVAKVDPKTLSPNAPSPPSQPATDASRFITVSHPVGAKSAETPKAASLLELAALDAAGTGATGDKSGIRLDEIDRAIIDSFLRNWTPPNASKLPLDQRTAHMDVTVNREGRLVRFKLVKTSGSTELDASVVEAGNRLDKIGTPLPASYPHDLYAFQVNFHVE